MKILLIILMLCACPAFAATDNQISSLPSLINPLVDTSRTDWIGFWSAQEKTLGSGWKGYPPDNSYFGEWRLRLLAQVGQTPDSILKIRFQTYYIALGLYLNKTPQRDF